MTEWDYVVVGAGSAGCVLADRLSATGATVLVLEGGGDLDWSPFIRIPAGLVKIPHSADWHYQGEPEASRGGLVSPWKAGKLLGGGSSVNGMVWVRGNPKDFDHWSSLGCTGWGYENVLPYFKRGETFEAGASEFRGGDGPQHVSFLRVGHEATEAFVQSAIASGFAFNEDLNGQRQEGIAYGQYSQRRGARHSSSRAYLAPARKRANLKVETGATVTKVIIEHGRAVGVEYLRRKKLHRARCAGEVVVSAGAIGSPKILLLSGIGPADELRAHGIEPVVDSPAVGEDLQEHLLSRLVYETTMPTFNTQLTPVAAALHALKYVVARTGPVSGGITHAQLFGSIEPREDGAPSFQIAFAPFGLNVRKFSPTGVDERPAKSGFLLPVNSVTTFAFLLHPRSRGKITLRSSDPRDAPRISYDLTGVDADLDELAGICEQARAVYATAPIGPSISREYFPGAEVSSKEEWRAHLRRNTTGGNHSVGTCKMGVDDRAVVDPMLRVRGVEGLRVVDASIMPTLPSGNTNAPTMMVAERGSDLVLGRSPTSSP